MAKTKTDDPSNSTIQIIQVLQRRHLTDQPVELLVKTRVGEGRLREVWMPQFKIMHMPHGRALLKAFDKTKVSQMGVDMYLGKRKRSISRGIIQLNQSDILSEKKDKAATKSLNDDKSKKEVTKQSTKSATEHRPNGKKRPSMQSGHGPLKKKFRCGSKKPSPQLPAPSLQPSSSSPLSRPTSPSQPTSRLSAQASNKFNSKLLHQLQLHPRANKLLNSKQHFNLVNKNKCLNDKFDKLPSVPVVNLSIKKAAVQPQTFECYSQQHSHYICCLCSKVISSSHSTIPKNILPVDHSQSKAILDQSQPPIIDKISNLECSNLVATKDMVAMETTSKESTSLERRWSIRQMEGAYRLKEMMVRKCEGYVHLVLGSESKNRSCFKNSFNPNMISELTLVLKNLMSDDSLVVLISGSGNTFSAGVDLHYLLHGESDRRIAARKMATHLKELVSVLIAFPKPLIAAVNGAASGLAVAMLPLLDLVYASDKASFSCPYVDVGQTPEACSSYTFQKIMGPAMANELLIRGRKVTALEAHQIGLVTQVFWPENFMSEVTPRVQNFAHLDTKAVTSTKMLMRHHKRAKLEAVNEAECQHLIDCWSSSRTQGHMKAYIERHNDWLAG